MNSHAGGLLAWLDVVPGGPASQVPFSGFSGRMFA